jgi:hypothetical protein
MHEVLIKAHVDGLESFFPGPAALRLRQVDDAVRLAMGRRVIFLQAALFPLRMIHIKPERLAWRWPHGPRPCRCDVEEHLPDPSARAAAVGQLLLDGTLGEQEARRPVEGLARPFPGGEVSNALVFKIGRIA